MNERIFSRVIFLFALYAVVAPTSVFAESFARNLKQGDQGQDVRLLQEILNRDPKTRIADTGPGSTGNETDYFGTKTYAAVVRFQEQYSQDILIPNGLFSGTGFVGQSTRAKLNALSSGAQAAISQTGGVVATTSPVTTQTPFYLMMPSSYSGLPGETITISGAGFTKTGNAVSFGGAFTVANVDSPTMNSITVTIPETIPSGRYALSAKNGNGATSTGLSFFVRKEGVSAPAIASVSSTRVAPGQTITITGSGFTPTGNTVGFGYASISGITSLDGRSITVAVPALPGPDTSSGTDNIPVSAALPYTVELPGIVYVENDGGVSKDALITIVVSFGN